MKLKNVKGFTISEMIIVLILTSIVVGMAFSVLGLVQRHMTAIKTNFNHELQFNKLETVLWLDFGKHADIRFNSAKDELTFKTALDSTVYQFDERYIIRETDTFPVKLEVKDFYFDGVIHKEGQIDAIKLKTTKDYLNKSLFVYKINDAKAYIN